MHKQVEHPAGSQAVTLTLPKLPHADTATPVGAYEDPDHPGCKREVRVEGMKVTWLFNRSGPGQKMLIGLSKK